MTQFDGYPGDALIDEANTLRELLGHPLIRATINLNWHNLADLSDMAIDTINRVHKDQREAARRRAIAVSSRDGNNSRHTGSEAQS